MTEYASVFHNVNIDKLDDKGSVALKLPRLVQGASHITKYRGTEVTDASIQSRMNELLMKSGCITSDRKEKCKHIRHCMATTVLAYSDFHHSGRGPDHNMSEMRARARHGKDTNESHYQLHCHGHTMARVKTAKSDLSVDHIIFLT